MTRITRFRSRTGKITSIGMEGANSWETTDPDGTKRKGSYNGNQGYRSIFAPQERKPMDTERFNMLVGMGAIFLVIMFLTLISAIGARKDAPPPQVPAYYYVDAPRVPAK